MRGNLVLFFVLMLSFFVGLQNRAFSSEAMNLKKEVASVDARLIGAKKCFPIGSTFLRSDQRRSLEKPIQNHLFNTLVASIRSKLSRREDVCSSAESLSRVSQEINQHINYSRVIESRFFHQKDYWQTVEEVLTPKTADGGRYGDCEDYALLKYWVLRSLGCRAENLNIVALNIKNLGAHAILIVKIADRVELGGFVLDNRDQGDSRFFLKTSYDPRGVMYLVNEEKQPYICGFAPLKL